MPRIPPSTFHQARLISGYLPLLLPATTTIASAQAELRWIKDHVKSCHQQNSNLPSKSRNGRREATTAESDVIRRLCIRRGRGEPLQYILGSQPFWPLDIKCRPGVLIPRQETEASIHHLATKLISIFPPPPANHPVPNPTPLRILDLCTGTGCIPLLLAHLLTKSDGTRPLVVHGIDISTKSIALARENIQHNQFLLPFPSPTSSSSSSTNNTATISFIQADLFVTNSDSLASNPLQSPDGRSWDVITCNPPYISSRDFAVKTKRSVRNWEPKLALVPSPTLVSHPGPGPGIAQTGGRVSSPLVVVHGCQESELPQDVFYARTLHLAAGSKMDDTGRPKVVFFEVGDMAQAIRVVALVLGHGVWKSASTVEIWRDAPDIDPIEGECTEVTIQEREISIRGTGEGRSVFIIRE